MSYDEGLLERCLDGVRDLHAGGVRHKNVFGMRGLLREGRMFAAVGEDSIVVRLTPEDYAGARGRNGVRPFMPDGTKLGRWIEIDAASVAEDPDLRDWLAAGLRSLG